MIRTLVLATAVVLLAAPAVQAQHRIAPRTQQPPIEYCDKTSKNNMDMLQCMSRFRVDEDARLNRAYKAALSRLRTPRDKVALRDVQRAWIKDRDAACLVYLDEAQYGRQGRVDAEDCVYEWTVDRADELERLYRPRR